MFQHVDGGDDAASRAAHAWLGTAGFHAFGLGVSRLEDLVQFHILAFVAKGIEHGLLGQATEQESGGIGLRVTADHHDLLAPLREPGNGVLGGGGLADATLAIDCDLAHGFLLVCRTGKSVAVKVMDLP